MGELFESDARRRLYVMVQDYPGLHIRELARRLGVKVRIVEYHAEVLLDEGLLERIPDGNYHRLYPNREELALGTEERKMLGVLRMPVPLGIVLALLDTEDGLPHHEICARVGTSKANASHHLRRLEACGLVEGDGAYRLTDIPRTRRLLRAHKPVPDLRKRFADTWASIYRK